MAVPKHQFVVDDSGEKKAVILDIADYQKLLEAAEELEAIPFDQAIDEIERNRK